MAIQYVFNPFTSNFDAVDIAGQGLPVLTAASANFTFSTAGADANYGALTTNSVTCTPGRWRITHSYSLNTGTAGINIFLYGDTGLYSANGANSATQPAALGGTTYGQVKASDFNTAFGLPNSSVAGLRLPAYTLVAVVDFTTTTTVYAVPRVGYSTASTASVIVGIVAEQVY